jgi:hypothetical protein
MATFTMVPTAISDPQANVDSGAATDIDNTIAGADDGALVVSTNNAWTNGPGTGSAFILTMSDAPGDFGSVNTVQFRTRAEVPATGEGDTTTYICDVSGTNAPTATASWDDTDDGGGFSNRGAGSPVASTASESEINAWTVRVYQNAYNQDMGPDGLLLNVSEVEIIVDYDVAAGGPAKAVFGYHQFRITS